MIRRAGGRAHDTIGQSIRLAPSNLLQLTSRSQLPTGAGSGGQRQSATISSKRATSHKARHTSATRTRCNDLRRGQEEGDLGARVGAQPFGRERAERTNEQMNLGGENSRGRTWPRNPGIDFDWLSSAGWLAKIIANEIDSDPFSPLRAVVALHLTCTSSAGWTCRSSPFIAPSILQLHEKHPRARLPLLNLCRARSLPAAKMMDTERTRWQ